MKRGRTSKVVDTNVAVVANKRHGESFACAAACALALQNLMRSGRVLLDLHGHIFAEYKRYLRFSGEPGAGDVFFRWLVNNRFKLDLCAFVPITPISDVFREYEEFPQHLSLRDFDRADQKFVAVAKAHPGPAEILQAVDSKWIGWHQGLSDCDVEVTFLCD